MKCSNNKLTANLDKTEAMIITQRPLIGPTIPIQFGECQIKVVSTTKSLGVERDNKLVWKKQLRKVTKTFGAKLSQLRKMKDLSKHVLEEINIYLFHAMISFSFITPLVFVLRCLEVTRPLTVQLQDSALDAGSAREKGSGLYGGS